MTARSRHLLTFGLLVLALAGLLGWAETTNWRELARLRRGLRETELESAAVEFQARLLARHGTLLAGEGDAADAGTFSDQFGPLHAVLRERQAVLSGRTPPPSENWSPGSGRRLSFTERTSANSSPRRSVGTPPGSRPSRPG